jgi:membrane protein DedA with SNARE-associated domain/rhodanese-related sulfurtransferase
MTYLIDLIREFGLGLVFINVLVEQAGAPVPAYPTLIIAGAYLTGTAQATTALLAVAVIAALISDTIWYLTGRRYGMRVLRTLCRISLSPDSCVSQTESIFTRFGPSSMLFAKFVPGFASVATAMAGAVGLRYWKFVLFDAVGALLWVGVAVVLGRIFRDAIFEVLETLQSLGKYGLILVLVALAAYIASKWWRRRQFILQLRMDRITVDELQDMMKQGNVSTILDVRSPLSQAASGKIPGARSIDMQFIAQGIDGVPTDGEVIVYCACPNEASAVKVAKKLSELGFKRVRPLHGGIDAWIEAGYKVESIVEDEISEPERVVLGSDELRAR